MESERLQKFMAKCGVASRRASEELIQAGRVRINGRTAKLGQKVLRNDKVELDGKTIIYSNKDLMYFKFYKPRGVVTTMHDEMGRDCIANYFDKINARVFPVGRLDRDSEGLLIVTNDGEIANKIMHPKEHLPKTYMIVVRGTVSANQLNNFENGVELEDGMTAPARIFIRETKEDRTVLEATIFEGRNRQIRRMCEKLELVVIRLKRERIGDIEVSSLRAGNYIKLSQKEIDYLNAR